MAFDDSNSNLTTDHLAEILAIVIEAETAIERSDLDENIAPMILVETVHKEIASKVIDHREIDPTRIDHPFAATTARTIPTVLPTVVAEIDRVEIGLKVIVLPTALKATGLRTEETTAETDHPIEAAVAIVPVAAIDPHIEAAVVVETDHRTEVVVEIDPVAAADSGPAVAADVLAAAVLDPAAAVADLHIAVPVAEIVPHEETNSEEATDVKVKKPRQHKQTKQPI